MQDVVEGETAEEGASLADARKKQKQKEGKRKKRADAEAEKQRQAELELLLMDDKALQDAVKLGEIYTLCIAGYVSFCRREWKALQGIDRLGITKLFCYFA